MKVKAAVSFAIPCQGFPDYFFDSPNRSTFYVPYDAEKQSESPDFSFMAPNEQAGTVEFVNYTDVTGEPAPLTVYLPYGYDPDGAPYKSVYLSHGMGGMTTTNVLFRVPEMFGYIGLQSGSDAAYDTTDVDWEAVKATKIMLGAGIYDFGLVWPFDREDTFSLSKFAPVLDEHGVTYGWEEVYGSHDWNTWPQLIKIFAENYLWK